MNEEVTEFDSVSALAKHLGISRKTLYDRAKRDLIRLDGVYTADEMQSLKKRGGKSVTETKVNNHSQKETQGNTDKQMYDELVESLKQQVNVLTDAQVKLYSELDVKNEQINSLNKQVDQSQQLQLIAEQRLSEEHKLRIEAQNDYEQATKKGFWRRLFG